MKILQVIKDRSSGATMPEFAIGFPLLVLLILFQIDAGLYLFQKSVVTDATAALNRAISTQLGQREADAYLNHDPLTVPYTLPPKCTELLTTATKLKSSIAGSKGILYDHITFSLSISSDTRTPFRLLTLQGQKPFQCLSCKFFGGSLNIIHRSVLVIERPNHPDPNQRFCGDIRTSLGLSDYNAFIDSPI